MPLFRSIVSWMMIKRTNEINLFKNYPIEVQQETFKKLIKKAKDTEWGKKYDYKSINTIEEYKRRVPLQYYDDIKPYVIRLRQGEQNLLWNQEIKWFAKSSGTTNDKSKFIPVSKDALEDCHFRGAKDTLTIYSEQYPDTEIFKGKGLTIGGSHHINNFSNASYYGDLSAILIKNAPFGTEFIRTPSQSVALMDEWEEKLNKMAHQTINENVTSIAGVPSWTLVLMKKILSITGKKNLLEVWPNLELFMHGGISFVPYREQYKKLIPSNDMHYLEIYNASEGFFGIQDDTNSNSMLLMLDYGIFYEFIPLENIHDEMPKTLSINQIELNKNYAIVISTNSGLWRYIIGDTIKFTSKYPFKFVITGRIKHFINAFGEELIIDNAKNALKIACDRTNAMINEYTAGPVYMSENQKGCHQWLFEFDKKPNNLEHFTELLDNSLKSFNSDYEAKRYKDISLTLPQIVCLKKGVFHEWLKRKGKLGGQHKIPRLANNRIYVDELLKINEEL
ncbi:MAG: hypothetical protein DRJ01_03790 [Bacteroidetes bacterium]|nr:MAG: hypothetical protein DRJ01_03790 [Bacteroidota bacterium]